MSERVVAAVVLIVFAVVSAFVVWVYLITSEGIGTYVAAKVETPERQWTEWRGTEQTRRTAPRQLFVCKYATAYASDRYNFRSIWESGCSEVSAEIYRQIEIGDVYFPE